MSDDELLKSLDTYACQLREVNAKLIYAAKARIEALRGEVESLKQAVEAEKDEQARIEFRLNEVTAERDRLKAALEKFIAEANTAPKRIIGNGIGGQTIEATMKASGRLISDWQLEQLRAALGGDAS